MKRIFFLFLLGISLTATAQTTYSIGSTPAPNTCGATLNCSAAGQNGNLYNGNTIRLTAIINGNQLTYIISKCDATAFALGGDFTICYITDICQAPLTRPNLTGGTFQAGVTAIAGTIALPTDFTEGSITIVGLTRSTDIVHYKTAGLTINAATTVGTINIDSKKLFQIYPNPTQSSLELQTDLQNYTVQFFDGLGRMCYEAPQAISGNTRLNLPNTLAKGIYYLKVKSEQGVFTQPFILQ